MPHRSLAALALACALFCSAPAAAADVPAALVRAIVQVETGGKDNVRGTHGEWGRMQIKCETARSVGFRGRCSELTRAATNLRFGTAYLAIAWRRARGDLCKTASLFNLGVWARARCTAYGKTVMRAMR
jgi:soluble lytic murein transglycosylase-like protein